MRWYIVFFVTALILYFKYFYAQKKKHYTELDVYEDFAKHFKPNQYKDDLSYVINNNIYFGLCHYLDRIWGKKIDLSLYFKIEYTIRLAVRNNCVGVYFNSPEARYKFIQNKIKELTKEKP